MGSLQETECKDYCDLTQRWPATVVVVLTAWSPLPLQLALQPRLPQLLLLGHLEQHRGLLKLDALTGIALGGAVRLLRALQVRG